MTPKPCSICGSVEYTSSYISKDGRRICNLHKQHSEQIFETLCKACGLKVVRKDEKEEEKK